MAISLLHISHRYKWQSSTDVDFEASTKMWQSDDLFLFWFSASPVITLLIDAHLFWAALTKASEDISETKWDSVLSGSRLLVLSSPKWSTFWLLFLLVPSVSCSRFIDELLFFPVEFGFSGEKGSLLDTWWDSYQICKTIFLTGISKKDFIDAIDRMFKYDFVRTLQCQ